MTASTGGTCWPAKILIGPLRMPDFTTRHSRVGQRQCPAARTASARTTQHTGKWRLLLDLSYPPGESINDGFDPALCSLSYTSVDHVEDVVARYQKGALLAKIDIEAAYRLVPVHPHDRPFQAMHWVGEVYFDPMLPFGLRLAPKIFNAIADGLEWYLRQLGVQHVFHYLDDFIVIGLPGSVQCAEAMASLKRACAFLGVPIATHKTEGLTTCLTYLGIEIDTKAAQLRLPADKLHRLLSLLREWSDRKSCSRRDLESLVGLLNHAYKVVRSGHSLLRRLINLLHTVPMHPHRPHPIRLNREFRADLAWWHLFVTEWNGVSILLPPTLRPSNEFASDASGSWGCGAWYGKRWFQIQWTSSSLPLPIVVKELLPIVMACELWGKEWQGQLIRCHCNNQEVVACLRSRTHTVYICSRP